MDASLAEYTHGLVFSFFSRMLAGMACWRSDCWMDGWMDGWVRGLIELFSF